MSGSGQLSSTFWAEDGTPEVKAELISHLHLCVVRF